MSFKNGDQCYYNNQLCTFVAKISDEESIVTFHYDDPEFGEPAKFTIPVCNWRITKDPIEIYKMIEKMELESRARIRQEEAAAHERLAEEKRAIEKARADIKASAQKYESLAQVIRYIEGEYHWIVTYNYGHSIQKLDEAKCRYDNSELALLSFRSKGWRKQPHFECYLSQYSDDSGSRERAWLFVTEQEAIEFVKDRIEKFAITSPTDIRDCDVERCGGAHMFSERVQTIIAERKESRRKCLESEILSTRKKLHDLEAKMEQLE